jgi:Na+-transporting NADH:ubiquinone oxidoreductase subunit C
MQKGDSYTILFATAVCVVCSLLLATAAALLKPRQAAMAELDRKQNVLKAFGVPLQDAAGRKITEAEVNGLFRDHIVEIAVNPDTGLPVAPGARSAAFIMWQENGVTAKYALPISGKGLWSTIYGYLALDRRAEVIVGVTFYRHGETPGLGGEVEKDWFQNLFKGKRIFKDGAPQRSRSSRGGRKINIQPERPCGGWHRGATLTGNGINQFLNAPWRGMKNTLTGSGRWRGKVGQMKGTSDS